MQTPVYVSDQLLARLERLALQRQTDRNILLSEAILGYLEQEEGQTASDELLSALSLDDISAINEAIADMEAGRTIPFAEYVKERQEARQRRKGSSTV